MSDDESACCEVRLFPLPGAVLLPHGLLPLHIFEPRYRQMTHAALETDRRIAIATPVRWPATEPVPIHEIVCVGKIANEIRLPDGRFKFVLQAERRVRIVRELPMDGRLYRRALAEPAPDHKAPGGASRRMLQRSFLLGLLAKLVSAANPQAKGFSEVLARIQDIGEFADVLGYASPLSCEVKNDLLQTVDVDRRLAILCNEMPKLLDRAAVETPPEPSFSRN
jgi:hypothetical protein